MAKRAAKNGFSVRKSGLPYDVMTFNPWSFFRGTLGKGRTFVDWKGTFVFTSDGSPHLARGHLMQIAYASENVPGFVDLVKYVGRTGDRDDVWRLLFDNAFADTTPFYTAHWVKTYKSFLQIRY